MSSSCQCLQSQSWYHAKLVKLEKLLLLVLYHRKKISIIFLPFSFQHAASLTRLLALDVDQKRKKNLKNSKLTWYHFMQNELLTWVEKKMQLRHFIPVSIFWGKITTLSCNQEFCSNMQKGMYEMKCQRVHVCVCTHLFCRSYSLFC